MTTSAFWEPHAHVRLVHDNKTSVATLGGIGALLINFNTAACTLRCLDSLLGGSVQPRWIIVLDNASAPADLATLQQGIASRSGAVIRLYVSEVNLGFAAGSNFLLQALMAEPECCHALLLNNDAVADARMVARLSQLIDQEDGQVDLAGGRMHQLAEPDSVDTLGIAIYASLMPADRKTLDDPYWGPTGGCCLLSRRLVQRLQEVSGYCFDPRYFCYCEDTDMVVRSRLLGFSVHYIDAVLAYHQGQASSGGGHNDFIAYHGLRNSLWMHVKLFPAYLFMRYGLLLVAAHGMTIVRYVLSGRMRVLLRVYRDGFSQVPAFWRERRVFKRHVTARRHEIRPLVAPHFYRKGYLRMVLNQFIHS